MGAVGARGAGGSSGIAGTGSPSSSSAVSHSLSSSMSMGQGPSILYIISNRKFRVGECWARERDRDVSYVAAKFFCFQSISNSSRKISDKRSRDLEYS